MPLSNVQVNGNFFAKSKQPMQKRRASGTASVESSGPSHNKSKKLATRDVARNGTSDSVPSQVLINQNGRHGNLANSAAVQSSRNAKRGGNSNVEASQSRASLALPSPSLGNQDENNENLADLGHAAQNAGTVGNPIYIEEDTGDQWVPCSDDAEDSLPINTPGFVQKDCIEICYPSSPSSYSENSKVPTLDLITTGKIMKLETFSIQINDWTANSPRGSHGRVAFGKALERNVPIAIKISKDDKISRTELEVFKKLSQDLHKKRIVHFYGHCSQDGLSFLVLEKLDITLTDAVKAHEKSGTIAFMHIVSRQVLLAVECLHRNKIIMADIHPDNVMLKWPYRVKLVDFGNAKIEGQRNNGSMPILKYRSPEALMGAQWSYPADMWSVGVVCLFMLYKKDVFYGDNANEILSCRCKLLNPPTAVLSGVPNFKNFFKLDKATKTFELRKKDSRTENFIVLKDIDRERSGVIGTAYSEFAIFIEDLLQWDASKRLTASQAFEMDFFTRFRNHTNKKDIRLYATAAKPQ